MDKLGVIGGMGPEATAYFYEEVIAHTVAARDQDHIDMVILSQASMPDRTEAILSGDATRLLDTMRADTRALEALGCANIAIPCNTSHYFYDTIQGFTHVPIIHMPREAVRMAMARGGSGAGADAGGAAGDAAAVGAAAGTHGADAAVGAASDGPRIGIMATDGTIRAGVYARECEAAGAVPVTPSPERQAEVMSIIYDDVKAGRDVDMHKFDRVMAEFFRLGCDAVILACTELSVIKRDHDVPDICLDAMDALVRESIVRSGARYR